jgi:hypothetical protein
VTLRSPPPVAADDQLERFPDSKPSAKMTSPPPEPEPTVTVTSSELVSAPSLPVIRRT